MTSGERTTAPLGLLAEAFAPTKLRRTLLVGIAFVAPACVQAPQPAAPRHDIEVLRMEVTALRAELALRNMQVANLEREAAASRACRGGTPCNNERPNDLETSDRMGMLRLHAIGARIRATLAAEGRDEPWARDGEAEIMRRALKTRRAADGLILTSASCGRTVCELDYTGPSPDVVRGAVLELADVVPWYPFTNAFDYYLDRPDAPHVKIYVSRQNGVLPTDVGGAQ